MTFVGTWLVMVGSGLALLQAAWIIFDIGRRRAQLRAEREASEARKEELTEVVEQLRERWGDQAAEIDNFEDLPGYTSSEELDALRERRRSIRAAQSGDDWIHSWNYFGRQNTHKHRELREVEQEWRRIWTTGVFGLGGAVMSLAGAVLLALATT
ncbi:hypothetical protein [Brachybacterium sp. SGAir0954]|uniref:hypothetical protein n=1 Tax=Brachybacterium sp. SGAir0954 TaxID=2571029 RepID=UPI0010F49A8C|nr:hypothetical protein [Brachybacterium sp. SGAir0954]